MAELFERTGGVVSTRFMPFYEGLKSLTDNNVSPLTLRDYAEKALQIPKEDFLKLPGGFTREGIVYVPGEKTILTRASPLLNLTDARAFTSMLQEKKHRIEETGINKNFELYNELRREFYKASYQIDPVSIIKLVEEDKGKPVEERRALSVDLSSIGKKDGGDNYREMPLDSLGNDEIFRWCFQDLSEEFGEFLFDGFGRGKYEDHYSIQLGGKNIGSHFGKNPFVRQFYFSAAEKGMFGETSNDSYMKYSVLGKK